VEATISARLTGGSSLLPDDFQGVFTASTNSVHDVEVMLLDFTHGKFPVSDDGTINLSRHVVSVGYNRNYIKDLLKVSIVAQTVEDDYNVTRDDI
jgi:hypothetical protein